jgi:RND family efflux transporter MFP subunit
VAVNQHESAVNQLADAELKLSYTKVAASWPEDPSGGYRYVGSRLVDVGQLVSPNTQLFEIVSIDPLLAEVDVIEKDYPKISVGMTALLTTEAFPAESFQAVVKRVAPILSSDSRQARLELEVKNPDLKLKPGMFSNVTFVFNQRPNVWSVSEDVPFRNQDGYVIFVADVKTGRVRQVPVELGLVEDGRVELVGLTQIDGPVVVLGQHLLKDGQSFKAAGEATLTPVPTQGANPSGSSAAEKRG